MVKMWYIDKIDKEEKWLKVVQRLSKSGQKLQKMAQKLSKMGENCSFLKMGEKRKYRVDSRREVGLGLDGFVFECREDVTVL